MRKLEAPPWCEPGVHILYLHDTILIFVKRVIIIDFTNSYNYYYNAGQKYVCMRKKHMKIILGKRS